MSVTPEPKLFNPLIFPYMVVFFIDDIMILVSFIKKVKFTFLPTTDEDKNIFKNCPSPRNQNSCKTLQLLK